MSSEFFPSWEQEAIFRALEAPRNLAPSPPNIFDISYYPHGSSETDFTTKTLIKETADLTAQNLWENLTKVLASTRGNKVTFTPPKIYPKSANLHMGIFAFWVEGDYAFLSVGVE